MTDQPGTTPTTGTRPVRLSHVWFVIGVVLVAANLRAAITGVGPLLPSIRTQTGLSSTAVGVVGTLPLLAFAMTAPLVSRTSQRVGSSRTLVTALVLVTGGIVLRSLPGVGSLFAGTFLLAAGIGVCNVLLPSIIRQSVAPENIGRVTGLYVTAMGLMAAIASGIAVPLAHSLPGGWQTSLAVWSVPCAVAVCYCLWTRLGAREPGGAAPPPSSRPVAVWSSALAWQVSIFMGLQSMVFYSVISWLPSIVADQRVSAQTAGWQLTIFQLVGMVSSLTVPMLTRHRRDQSAVAAASSSICAVGLLVLLLLPTMSWLAVILVGLGSGSSLVLALSFQGLRAPDAASAASLAGMAQTIGYLLAAIAPLGVGLSHDVSGSWHASLVALVALALLQAVFGLAAGRDRTLPSPRDGKVH